MKVNKEIMRGFLKVIPRRDPRKILLGVHHANQDGREVLEATDGRKLLRLTAPADGLAAAGERVIPVEAWRTLAGLAPTRGAMQKNGRFWAQSEPVVIGAGAEGKVTALVSRPEFTTTFETHGIEGNYPNTGSVIHHYKNVTSREDKREAVRLLVNGDYLIEVCQAVLDMLAGCAEFKSVAERRTIELTVPTYPNAPLQIRALGVAEGMEALGLVMAVRRSDIEEEIEEEKISNADQG